MKVVIGCQTEKEARYMRLFVAAIAVLVGLPFGYYDETGLMRLWMPIIGLAVLTVFSMATAPSDDRLKEGFRLFGAAFFLFGIVVWVAQFLPGAA